MGDRDRDKASDQALHELLVQWRHDRATRSATHEELARRAVALGREQERAMLVARTNPDWLKDVLRDVIYEPGEPTPPGLIRRVKELEVELDATGQEAGDNYVDAQVMAGAIASLLPVLWDVVNALESRGDQLAIKLGDAGLALQEALRGSHVGAGGGEQGGPEPGEVIGDVACVACASVLRIELGDDEGELACSLSPEQSATDGDDCE